MDLHSDLSPEKDLCNSSAPEWVMQEVRSHKVSVQSPGIRMTDNLGRQSCDYTDLSLESTLICSSALDI